MDKNYSVENSPLDLVRITSPNGSILSTHALFSPPKAEKPHTRFLYLGAIGILLLISFMVPPLLLLNLPLLVLRSCFIYFQEQVETRRVKVQLASFICPECGQQTGQMNLQVEVPTNIICPLCKSVLQVERIEEIIL